ncbi:MAG TPA: hypothetical protein VJ933_12210, partial [Phaeodactylibacter sp.]|nr:hypothetical protein [Phaeodactylibacter sp.]
MKTLLRAFCIPLLLFVSASSWGQEKVLTASRAYQPITIDGKDTEQQWSHADIATHFLERNPT